MEGKHSYNCIIIDDEPIAIRVIQDHLKSFDQMNCLGGFTKAMEALQFLQKERVDLIFLDINMPTISGIDLLKSLPYPPKIIFTTAYRNYAAEAFDLDAIDYLVKPISFERFLKAMQKFFAQIEQAINSSEETADQEYLVLKSDKKNHKIPLIELLYIEGLDNYIRVQTTEKTIICYEKLSAMEKKLPFPRFMRIHRSCIANLDRVDVFTSAHVEIGGKSLSIGRSYKKEVTKQLNPKK